MGALSAVVAMVVALPILRPRRTELRDAEMLTVSIARLKGGDARLFRYRDRAGERLRFLLARDFGIDGVI